MIARTLVLVLVLTSLVGVGVVAAPAAVATHSCGWDLPCAHPDDVFCLPLVKKFVPGLCPYG